MRILIVTRGHPSSARFGLEHYSWHLARGLARAGHDVRMLHPEAEAATDADREGVSVGVLPAQQKQQFGDEFDDAGQNVKFLESFEGGEYPDVVLFLALGGGVSTGLVHASKQFGARVVFAPSNFSSICHRGHLLNEEFEICEEGLDPARCAECCRRASPYVRDHDKAESRERWAARLDFLGKLSPFVSRSAFAGRLARVQKELAAVDRVLAWSDAMGERLVQWGIPQEKVTKAPRAFDPSLYEGFARTPRQGPFRFGFVGQFAPQKGLHILIDAVRGLYGRQRGFMLTLHGAPSGTMHPDYGVMMVERGKALHLPIEDRGPFEPEQTASVFAGLDAVVIPSMWMENLPATLLHARATKTPVITTNVPGIREFVRNNIDGTMVTPGNSTSLAERMEKLMTDPEMLKKFSDSASVPETFADHVKKVEAALAGG